LPVTRPPARRHDAERFRRRRAADAAQDALMPQSRWFAFSLRFSSSLRSSSALMFSPAAGQRLITHSCVTCRHGMSGEQRAFPATQRQPATRFSASLKLLRRR
jgi:hypothetical protein